MAKFKVLGPPPHLLAVTKEGQIKALPYARNSNERMVTIHANRPRLAPEAQDRGYVLLEKCYADDPREWMQQNGFKTYTDWEKALINGTAPRKEVQSPSGKGTRKGFADFPERYLPQEVIQRRAGTANVSKTAWVAPEMDGPELDESGDVVKPKAQKPKAKASA